MITWRVYSKQRIPKQSKAKHKGGIETKGAALYSDLIYKYIHTYIDEMVWPSLAWLLLDLGVWFSLVWFL